MDRFHASRTLRRTMLAFGLCILAFGFAMEAKLAWYIPDGSAGRDIVATKALPADQPIVVVRGVHAPNLVIVPMIFVFAAALTSMSLRSALAAQRWSIANKSLSVSSAAYFSHNLFFRPPPIR